MSTGNSTQFTLDGRLVAVQSLLSYGDEEKIPFDSVVVKALCFKQEGREFDT
jgi:hypothetical protein